MKSLKEKVKENKEVLLVLVLLIVGGTAFLSILHNLDLFLNTINRYKKQLSEKLALIRK